MLRLLCDLHKHVLNFGNCLASNLRGGEDKGGGGLEQVNRKRKKSKWSDAEEMESDMMRREQTCGNQDGERRKKRERVWLSDSVNPGLGSLPLIPLFPLIKTAELPLISSLSLSISSFLPSLSPPPPAPNPLLQSFLFFFPHCSFSSPKVHMDQPVGNHVCPRRVTLFLSFFFFYCFHVPAALSFLCPLVFSLPPRASSVRWSSSNDRSRGLLLRTTKCSCERFLHPAEGE